MGPVLKYCMSLPQIAAELCSSDEEGVGQPMIVRVRATTLRSTFLTAVVQRENHKQTRWVKMLSVEHRQKSWLRWVFLRILSKHSLYCAFLTEVLGFMLQVSSASGYTHKSWKLEALSTTTLPMRLFFLLKSTKISFILVVPLHFVAVCSLFPTRDDTTRVVSSANFIVLLLGWVEMS